MWYQLFIPSPLVIIPVLVMTTKCHTPKDNGDVIVISSKHAEAMQSSPIKNDTAEMYKEKLTIKLSKEIENFARETTTIKEVAVPSNEDILFIPDKKHNTEKKRVEDYWRQEVEDEPEKMTLNDFINHGEKVVDTNIKMEAEKPSEDIIFITGKNHDILDKPVKKDKKNEPKEQNNYKKHPEAKGNLGKLNCNNLDCDNDVKSVCGGKMENKKWKYRLFLNECYFRKVNCFFKKRESRYQEVAINNCHSVATHSKEPVELKLYQYKPSKTRDSGSDGNIKLTDTRRMTSRRSLSMGIDGRLCSHPCPVSCSEHYEPECAVSGTGRIRVFMNHCKMDWHSCFYGVVWHRRPLADCVGGKKADMRQNRGFINWMQSVGIVDNKGRLVLN